LTKQLTVIELLRSQAKKKKKSVILNQTAVKISRLANIFVTIGTYFTTPVRSTRMQLINTNMHEDSTLIKRTEPAPDVAALLLQTAHTAPSLTSLDAYLSSTPTEPPLT
jgi:hypothetical protein